MGPIFEERFKIKRWRRLLLFIVCLFLAFVIWTIHKLSDNYSQFFRYKVYLTTAIEGRESSSPASNNLSIRGRASGFYILQYRSTKSATISIAPLAQLVKEGERNGRFYLLTHDVKDLLVEAIGERVTLEYISSDTLFFEFPPQGGKSVPIAINSKVVFEEQYTSPTGIKISPSHLYITGKEGRLEEIDTLYTAPIVLNGVDKSESGVVKVLLPPGVRATSDEVYYSLETTRYIEQSFKVPLTVVGVTDSTEAIVSPKVVTLYIRRAVDQIYKERGWVAPSMSVDCSKFSSEGEVIMAPTVPPLPTDVIDYRVEPPLVQVTIYKIR